MIRAREDRLFERFRRTGDTRALAEVFDRTATELWRVASHLAHDQDLAADAVQGTFLRAIEDAASWDRTRPVVPWLFGILTNQVRGLRRTRARTPDPERLAQQRTTDPAEAAAAGELDARLRSAIAGVPVPYREVVERHLLLGKGASEIAAELGVRQGTARMRLHRGLSWLRRALQPGFASLGVVALYPDPAQLAAVRTAVLTHRTLAGVAVAPAGAGLGVATLLGGLIVKKTLWGAACAVVLAAAGWWTWSELNGAPRADPTAREQAEFATPLASADPLPAPATSPEVTEPASRRATTRTADMRRGKVRVRVTHAATREPVAGAQIEWRGRHVNYGETDAAGEWVVEDQVGRATVELPRREQRQQCQVEADRETLVRVELPVRVQVDLRVVDDKRAPIAGARVFGKVRDGHIRWELLGVTDRQGRFEHASLFAGPELWAEADGFVPCEMLGTGGERETRLTRTVTLLRGAGTVRGRVVDADGQGVAGTLVAIYGQARRARSMETASLVRTDGDGRFTCHCVPAGRVLLFALHDRRPEHGFGFLVARRAARGAADVVAGAPVDCELRLASATVTVTLAGARPEGEQAWVRAELFEPELNGNLRNELTRGSGLDAAGRAVLEGILPGRYRLKLSLANRAVTEDVDLVDGQTFAWSPVLEAPRDLRLRLVDDRDAPLAGLGVRVEGSRDRMVATTVSDAAGCCAFSGIANDTFQVSVSWPGEDHEAARFTGMQPLATEQVLRLAGEQRPGSLTGGLTSEAGPLPDGLRVEIQRLADGRNDAFARFATVTPATGGRFTVPHVRPGTYLAWIRLRDAVVAQTPQVMLAPGAAGDFGTVSIRGVGKLEVTARGAAATSGQLLLAIRLEAAADPARPGAGRFIEVPNSPGAPLGMDPMPTGPCELLVWGETVAPATTAVTVAPGETTRVEMSLTEAVTCTLRFSDAQQRAMHTLTVRDTGGREVVSVVISNMRGGELRRGLPAGSYTLELEDFRSKARVRRSLEVIPGQPATVSFAE